MHWLAVIILFVGVHYIGHSFGYDQGYDQGRKDKHAETMQFIAGNRTARLAIVNDGRAQYHEAGVCAACHTGG